MTSSLRLAPPVSARPRSARSPPGVGSPPISRRGPEHRPVRQPCRELAATHEHHADQLAATAQNDQMIIPIDQDPQATTFDHLHESLGIVPQTMVPRGDAPGNRDHSAELIQDRVASCDNAGPAGPGPSGSARKLRAPRPAQIELANQQTRPSQRREMDPHVFFGSDQDRRLIARDVAHFQPAAVERPREPLTVAAQRKRASARSARQRKQTERPPPAKRTESREPARPLPRPESPGRPHLERARTSWPPLSAGLPSTRGVSDTSLPVPCSKCKVPDIESSLSECRGSGGASPAMVGDVQTGETSQRVRADSRIGTLGGPTRPRRRRGPGPGFTQVDGHGRPLAIRRQSGDRMQVAIIQPGEARLRVSSIS